jgi:DNA repair exonuclease SbcCD ATPase subunit
MTKPYITRIELQGFRSFGQARQILDLPVSVAALWGGNSQGKTSFAEALEFLLTGQIARRELLASTKDEFIEAIRNVHIAPTHAVVVEAHVSCSDGKVRRLTRTLVEDYKRGVGSGCASRLEIDGRPCVEDDIESTLGLRLSQPPLRAPVLAQHTLAYLFSVSPADRAAYFRALLDTQDLEDFRSAVAALQSLLVAPSQPEIDDLIAVEAIPALAATTMRKSKTEADLRKHLAANNSALLASIGLTPVVILSDQADESVGWAN